MSVSGLTFILSGSTVVRVSLTIKASGWPGSLLIEASTSSQNAATIQQLATSSQVYTSGAALSGVVADGRTTTRTGKTTRTGASARQAEREGRLLADASEDVTVEDDVVQVRQTMTGTHAYTLRHTGTVPTEGEWIRAYRSGTSTPSAHSANFVREDSTVVFTFHASKQGWAWFRFDGFVWQLIAWSQFASGDSSGSYGDVW